MPEPGEVFRCRAKECDARIVKLRQVANPQKVLVIDVEPHPAGNVRLVKVGSEWRAEVMTHAQIVEHGLKRRWVSHFATCTAPEKFRSGGKK